MQAITDYAKLLLLPSSFQMLSTIKINFLSSFLERPLCCLAFITLIHCSVFKVQSPAFTKTRNKYSILFEYLFPSLPQIGGPEWARTTDLTIISRTL